jgi:hypothetical protein
MNEVLFLLPSADTKRVYLFHKYSHVDIKIRRKVMKER